MNIKNEESSIETLATHQKRSRTAHLQLESTTRTRASTDHWYVVPRGSEAAEKVISAPPPAARRRAKTSSADIQSITTATVPDRHAAVSNNKSTSVSVDREIQSVDKCPPEKSKHAEPRKLHLRRQNLQINAVNVQTSPKSTSSAIKCRIADTTPMEKTKIAEITASATTGKKKVHRHRFRRKKRQKDRRNSQEE